MKKFFLLTTKWVSVLAVGVIIGITLKLVSAWVEPEQYPPGGNIAAPLNTGNVGQSKQGGLTLNIGGAQYGLIVKNGLVGIGTDTPKAVLDVSSTSSGFLPPRMTEVQRDAIQSPQLGMLIYNTDTKKVNSYNGISWEEVGGGNSFDGNLNGNLNVNGNVSANAFCLGGDCKTHWPDFVIIEGRVDNGDCWITKSVWTGCPGGYQIVYTGLAETGNYPWESHKCFIQDNGIRTEVAGCTCYTECFGLCMRSE